MDRADVQASKGRSMTPDEIDRLYESLMLAAPMALLGVVLLVLGWRWPTERGP